MISTLMICTENWKQSDVNVFGTTCLQIYTTVGRFSTENITKIDFIIQFWKFLFRVCCDKLLAEKMKIYVSIDIANYLRHVQSSSNLIN